MTTHRLSWLVLLLPALVAGCSADAAGQTPAAPPPAPAEPRVPTARADVPDGVYRTELPVEKLRALGADDPGMAGTWTLTVKAGTFILECKPVTTSGIDCGTHDPTMPDVVEAGPLRGSGSTVWFLQDPERRVKLTGCVRHSQKRNGCGPEDAYHLDVTPRGRDLSFRNCVGLGDQVGLPELSNWTAQPWTR